jgi:hypothetical protein
MISSEWIARKGTRISFYARGAILDMVPYLFFEKRFRWLKPQLEEILSEQSQLRERVAYYNQMPMSDLPPEAKPISRISRSQSYYFYDLRIPAKYFGRSRRVNYVFGDVTSVPPWPALVKSRPISGDNKNSILFKLDRLRHFDVNVILDTKMFRDKKPVAVWRGSLNNEKRKALVARYSAHSLCDIGHVSKEVRNAGLKKFLKIKEQLAYRYIVSVEGHDVSTNLKWIMSSRSLCFMPQPRFETWFMEGSLQSGVHYVGLRDDFEDLEDKIAYYNDNVAEAEEIVANANTHFRLFLNTQDEELCQLAVLYKYFRLTGQL